MKIAIETMVDFIFLVLLIIISSSFIILHLNEQKARNFHALAIDEIENSHFSEIITEGLVLEAKKQGYELIILKKVINEEPIAEVSLKYDYHLPLLQLNNGMQVIRGTAR